MSDTISNAETTANVVSNAAITDPTDHSTTTNSVVMAAMSAILADNARLANATATSSNASTTVGTLLGYASSRQNRVLAGTWSFNVAAEGEAPHVVTTTLGADGQFSMLKIKVWAQDNLSANGATLSYSNVDFTSTLLTPQEALSLVDQTSAVDLKSYQILNEVAAGIKAMPPTILMPSQIDTAFAALTVGQP
jgi:hypothetical protein